MDLHQPVCFLDTYPDTGDSEYQNGGNLSALIVCQDTHSTVIVNKFM